MPAKLDRCVADLEDDPNIDNPFAVCNASINEVDNDIAKSMHEQQFGSENWMDEKKMQNMVVESKLLSTEVKNTVLGMSQNFYEKIFFHDKIEQGNSFDNKVTQEFIKVIESIIKDFPHVQPTQEFIAIEMMRRGCDELLAYEFVKNHLSFEIHKNPEMFPNVTNIQPNSEIGHPDSGTTVPNINKEEDFEPNDTLFGGQKRQDALHPEAVEKKKVNEVTSEEWNDASEEERKRLLDKNDVFLANLDADWDELPDSVRDDLSVDVEQETADEDSETPSMLDAEDDAREIHKVETPNEIPFPEEEPHATEQNGMNAMMNGEPMPEPEPMRQGLFPFGRLTQDRCRPGEHFCEQEGKCVPDKAEELPPCPPGHILNEMTGECEQVVSDADIPELQLKANQTERVHHVANSAMNNRPKEVGPLTQMDFGFPEDVTEQSGFFEPLRPTLSPLEPNSSNRPCDKGKVLNPVTGICEPQNLTNQLTDPDFLPPTITGEEKINYPDYVTKVEENFECGCQNKTQEAIQVIETST